MSSNALLNENQYYNAYCGSLTCENITTQNPISLFCSNNGSPSYNESNNEVPVALNGTVKYSNGVYIDPEDNRKIRFTKTGIYSFSVVCQLFGQAVGEVDDATACYSLYSQLKQFENDGTLLDYTNPYSSTFNISAGYLQNNTVIGSFNIDNVNQFITLFAGIASNHGLTLNWSIQFCELKIDLFAVAT